jgi:hypothetical protein
MNVIFLPLVQRMKAGAGPNLARSAMGFFANVPNNMVYGVRKFQHGAAKYAIALGIDKLPMFVVVSIFKVLNLGHIR